VRNGGSIEKTKNKGARIRGGLMMMMMMTISVPLPPPLPLSLLMMMITLLCVFIMYLQDQKGPRVERVSWHQSTGKRAHGGYHFRMGKEAVLSIFFFKYMHDRLKRKERKGKERKR